MTGAGFAGKDCAHCACGLGPCGGSSRPLVPIKVYLIGARWAVYSWR